MTDFVNGMFFERESIIVTVGMVDVFVRTVALTSELDEPVIDLPGRDLDRERDAARFLFIVKDSLMDLEWPSSVGVEVVLSVW